MRSFRRQTGFTMLELLIVVSMGLIVAGFAIPTYQRTMRNYRLQGDARALNGEIQLAKMRAAANFTRARVRFASGGTYVTEVWCKAANSPRVCTTGGVWRSIFTGGTTNRLAPGIRYGIATQTLPPPGTQAALAQPMPCRFGILATSLAIPGTGCIVFNSRGYPIDGAGNPYGDYGIYITDGTAVQGTTVSRTGVTASWRHDVQDTTAESWFRH